MKHMQGTIYDMQIECIFGAAETQVIIASLTGVQSGSLTEDNEGV